VSALKEKEDQNQLTPQDEEDKKPKAPEPDPTDLLNLLKDDSNERDEKRPYYNTPKGTEKEGSVIGTQEETTKAEQELLQGRLPSDQGTDVLRTEEGEKARL